MSEAYVAPGEAGDESTDHDEVDETDAPETGEDGDGDGEETSPDGEPVRKPVDWEKRAHDKAGQAAKERSRRRAVERSLGELQTRFESLESRVGGNPDELAALITSLRDDDDEPITDINQIKKALKLFLSQQEQDNRTAAQRNQNTRAVTQVMSSMQDYEHDFASEHADYFEAAKFYRAGRQAELEDLGFTGPALQQVLARDLFGAVQSAIDGGRDPAEVVYGLAKRRGFQAGKGAATAKLQKMQKAGGVAPSPGGSSPSQGLSWTAVAKLTGPERDKAFAQLRKRELGRK